MIFRANTGKQLRGLVFSCSLFLVSCAGDGLAQQAAPKPVRFDAGTISGLPARNIGSAVMSGRGPAVTEINDKGRLILFAGAAGDGVWKLANGGSSFRSVFVHPAVQSIG